MAEAKKAKTAGDAAEFSKLAAEYKQLKAQKAALLQGGGGAAAPAPQRQSKYAAAAQKLGLPVALLEEPTSVAAMSGSCGVLEEEIQGFVRQMTANMGQMDASGMCAHPAAAQLSTLARRIGSGF